MKKLIILLIFCCAIMPTSAPNCLAESEQPGQVYSIYDELGNFIMERAEVEIGDSFITKDFLEYEIKSIDKKNYFAKAVFVKEIKRPNISRSTKKISRTQTPKKIALYLTHNDESYLPSDGYDSIWGEGGIHDVAHKLKKELNKHGIEVVLDETLHIPHDKNAYSRSGVTAAKLMKQENPDALFDIHRDGVDKKYYETTVNGKKLSKFRIYLGKANPNFNKNFEFATYLYGIGQELYPWLFGEIYIGNGHYNQGLYSKALLFEMGTYLQTKEEILDTVPYFADIINTALYNTQIDNDDNLNIGGSENKEDPNLNDYFNYSMSPALISLIVYLVISLPIFFGIMVFITNKNKKTS